jgi:hypothetical protein
MNSHIQRIGVAPTTKPVIFPRPRSEPLPSIQSRHCGGIGSPDGFDRQFNWAKTRAVVQRAGSCAAAERSPLEESDAVSASSRRRQLRPRRGRENRDLGVIAVAPNTNIAAAKSESPAAAYRIRTSRSTARTRPPARVRRAHLFRSSLQHCRVLTQDANNGLSGWRCHACARWMDGYTASLHSRGKECRFAV